MNKQYTNNGFGESRLICKNPETSSEDSEISSESIIPSFESIQKGIESFGSGVSKFAKTIKERFSGPSLPTSSTKEELQEREKIARMTPEKLKKMSPEEIKAFFTSLATNNKRVLEKIGAKVDAAKGIDERGIAETVLDRSNCPEICIYFDALKDDPERQKAMLDGVSAFTSTIGFTIEHTGGEKTEFGIKKVEAFTPENLNKDASENTYNSEVLDGVDELLKILGVPEKERGEFKNVFAQLLNISRPVITKKAQQGTSRQELERDKEDYSRLKDEKKLELKEATTEEQRQELKKVISQIDEQLDSLEESLEETEALMQKNTESLEEVVKMAGDLDVTTTGSSMVIHGDREQVEKVCSCVENQGHMVNVYPGGTGAAITLPDYRTVSPRSVFGFSAARAPQYFKTDVKRSTQVDVHHQHEVRDLRQAQLRQRALQHRRNLALQNARNMWCKINGTRMPARSTWSNLNHTPFQNAGVVYGGMQRRPCVPGGWNRPGVTGFQRNYYNRNLQRFRNAQQSMLANQRHFNYHQAQSYKRLRR